MSTVLRSDAQGEWLLASEWCAPAAETSKSRPRFMFLRRLKRDGCSCIAAAVQLPSPIDCSGWTTALQAYCAASAEPVSVHVHNYSGFAVRQCGSGKSDVKFVLGADAWSSS
jgi:hypothetical protein